MADIGRGRSFRGRDIGLELNRSMADMGRGSIR